MRTTVTTFIAALLAGCVGRPAPVAVAITPPPLAVVVDRQAPAPNPINAGLSEAATLWHLRAGLNVAALACRGPEEAVLVAGYNALLARHAVPLKAAEAAYAAEYQAATAVGRDRYDDQMTRLYNHFGQSRGRSSFCAAARVALVELETTLDPAADAGARLASLDQPFAPPWLSVDPRVFGEAPVQLASR
ncbi:MAG: hypothetical protein JWN21_2606 [Sphingomonas bacterium]|uniref:hypothetical protein n=1 Tax=Sphingomonas bacterium TaxID=1895847 RepID=UPI00261B0232|nr:hypothetical protein [Sphingomonas bacterium]MDB5697063.1 hypothetical protein [Sphingomonas bacterium]